MKLGLAIALAIIITAAGTATAHAWGKPTHQLACTPAGDVQFSYANPSWGGEVEVTAWLDGSHALTTIRSGHAFTVTFPLPAGEHVVGVRYREKAAPNQNPRYVEKTLTCSTSEKPPAQPPVQPPAVIPPPSTVPPVVTPPKKPAKPRVCVNLRNGTVRIKRRGLHVRLTGKNLRGIRWWMDQALVGKGRRVTLPGPLARQRLSVKADRVGTLNGRRVTCGKIRLSVKVPNLIPPGGGGRG